MRYCKIHEWGYEIKMKTILLRLTAKKEEKKKNAFLIQCS